MKLTTPPPEVVPFGLRAMNVVARGEAGLSPAARQMLEAAQKQVLKSKLSLDGLAPIEPGELAEAVTDPAMRQQLVEGMVLVSLADGPPSEEKAAHVERFAEALGVKSAAVRDLRLLAEHDMLLFRLDFLRRSHMRDVFKQQVEETGLLGTAKAILGMRGIVEDAELAARYTALEKLPPGTLGRVFFDHIRKNGFNFPGEKLGFPEGGIYHDFTHVLSGYDTTPEGELQVGAFTAGYKRQNPFHVLLFVVLTFSAGVNMTPLPQKDTHGIFAEEGLAERVLVGLRRGAKVKVDLSDRWDHWSYVDKPIDEVRRELGVEP